MSAIVTWIRLSICRLSIMLGVFCFVEITFGLLERTNPNVRFPSGHYRETLAVIGIVLLAVGYITWTRPKPHMVPAEAADKTKPAR